MGFFGLDTGGLGIPTFSLDGFFSSTWMWVALVVFVGVIAIAGIAVLLFYITFSRTVVLFENVSGQGFQPTLKTRARKIKMTIGDGGDLFKTLRGGQFVTAYGRKMGKNTYWFAKGQDGFYYNFLLGDLDSKMGMLDIEPIERDVRAFQIVLDRYSHQSYGKQGFLEKYAIHMLLFVFLIILILGMWFIVGKIGEATAPLAQAGEMAVKIQEATDQTVAKLDSLIRAMQSLPPAGSSGLAPAPLT